MPQIAFVSYSHEDDKFLRELAEHLKASRVQIDAWDDRRIRAGDNWDEQIQEALSSAHIFVLLVSPPFLASDYVTKKELRPMLARAKKHSLRILPILIRAVDFSETPLAKYQFAYNAKPLPTSASQRDKAWASVIKEIRATLNETVRNGKARRKRLVRETVSIEPALRASRFERTDLILPTGAVEQTVVWEDLEPLGGVPVLSFGSHVLSESGRPAAETFECVPAAQRIVPIMTESKPGQFEIVNQCCPPLSKGSPVRVTRIRRVSNAFYFSKEEAEDASPGKENESTFQTLSFECDRLTMSVIFPERCFPDAGHAAFAKSGEAEDAGESNRVSHGFVSIPLARTLILDVQQPKLCFTYGIQWQLPSISGRLPDLDPVHAAVVEEINQRIFRLRSWVPRIYASLLRDLRRAATLIEPTLGPDLETTLFLYDRSIRGLRCAAGTGPYSDAAALWSHRFIPGRGIPGQTYRRRSVVHYVALPGYAAKETEHFEPIEGADNPNQVILGIPLFHPSTTDRAIGVLTLSSSSGESPLARLEPGGRLNAAAAKSSRAYWRIAENLGRISTIGLYSGSEELPELELAEGANV